jgi:hypothetical protein
MGVTEKDKRPLNTDEMQAKLKGDSFPDMPDDFLDEDIKAFFNQALKGSGRSMAEVIRRANIPRTYGYQIIGGKRLGKRDYYLSLAIAMKLDLTQTQRMLAVAHCGGLHALIKRDAAVIFAVNHGYDNETTYTFMVDLELPPLDTGLEDEK